MTITLTKEELREFQSALSEWYRKQILYVLERTRFDYRGMGTPRDQISQLILAYEKENPKPDWRSLL